MRKYNHFLVQAARLGSLTLVSSVLGFAREVLIARDFGASHVTDSYLVALSVPMLIYVLFFGSGLNVSLVPRLSTLLSQDATRGRQVFAQFLSAAALWSGLASSMIFLFPRVFVHVFAPGMAASPVALGFVRTLAPLLFIFVITFALGSFHCARDRTSNWALITVVQNVTLVVALLLLGRMGGAKILLFGTIAGALLSFIVQARVARLDGFRETWVSPFRRGEGVSILASMIPFAFVFGLGGDYGTGQVDIFLVRLFASRLTPGSITLLALGNKLMALPVVFIGAALGLALLPSLSVAIAKESWEKASRDFAQAMSYAFLAVCPIAVIYFDLGVPMARLAFERTALTPNQLEQLGAILRAYAGAVIGLVLVYILNSYLAALRQTRALIGAGVATAAIDALLMAVFWHRYQAPGIAVAISIGSFFYCILLLGLLAKFIPRVARAELFVRAVIIIIGAVGMHLVLIFTVRLNVFTSAPLFGNAVLPIVAGLLMYVTWLVLHRGRLQLTVVSF